MVHGAMTHIAVHKICNVVNNPGFLKLYNINPN